MVRSFRPPSMNAMSLEDDEDDNEDQFLDDLGNWEVETKRPWI